MSGIQQLLLGANSGAAGGGAAAVPFELLKVALTLNSNVNDSSTFTQRSVFSTGTPLINEGGFSVSSSSITIPSTGIYLISGNFHFSSSVSRSNVGVRFHNQTTNTSLNDITASNYIRNASSHNMSSSHLTTIYEFSANDQIGTYFRLEGASGSVTLVANSSTVEILRLA